MDDLIGVAATALSYAIVAGSSALKLPQLYKIVSGRSAEGISLTSLHLECLSYAITTSWGLARGLHFKDYGESIIISAQLSVLVVLVGYFQRQLTSSIALLSSIVILGVALSRNIAPLWVHEALMTYSIGVSLFSRVPQIYVNFKRRSTGQLAFLTFFLAFGGGAARILTVALNVPWAKGKATLLLQFAVSTTLNLAVLAQMFHYRQRAKKLD